MDLLEGDAVIWQQKQKFEWLIRKFGSGNGEKSDRKIKLITGEENRGGTGGVRSGKSVLVLAIGGGVREEGMREERRREKEASALREGDVER